MSSLMHNLPNRVQAQLQQSVTYLERGVSFMFGQSVGRVGKKKKLPAQPWM